MDFDEEDLRISEIVKEALSRSPAWDKEGFLRLNSDNWLPLDIAAKKSPEESGLYALGLSDGLHYDQAVSRIIYLGSAKNLEKRIRTHKNKPHNYVVELFYQNFPDGIRVAWWATPGFNRKFLYGIEGEALLVFEKVFGALPICNLDVPEFFEGQEYCTGLVQIFPCETKCALETEELAHKLDRVLVRKELEPTGGGVTFEISIGALLNTSVKGAETLKPKRRVVELLAREQAELKNQSEGIDTEEDNEECEEEMRLHDLSLIHDEHVAAWSIDKMRDVIRLCNQLKPKKTKAKTMMPFEVSDRSTPVPHTWGEIALIQARIVGGSWQPGKQVWVKISHGNKLLGEARLNKGWYRGEDKSDLPQRKTIRPRCQDFELKNEQIEYGDNVENIYGLEISTSRHAENISHKQIEDEIREAKEALWQAVEDLFQRAMRKID